MNVALIGARGQLGTALQDALAGDVTPLNREQIDLADAASVAAALTALQPDVVVNAAAYNFVDRAEDEPDVAFAVNGLGPRNLALYCRDHDAVLVHVGSDYVFSGTVCCGERAFARGMPYREPDTPGPQSAYAVSKLAGEAFVRSLCPRHVVVRTCGLYGQAGSAGKGNFVTTMLRLAGERDELSVVDDQRCTPTSAADLAGWIARLIETGACGVYHATNSGSATWCEFAREILRLAGIDVPVRPITTAAFGAKAARPAYSVLCCRKLETVLGAACRGWQDALAEYVESVRRSV